MFEFLCWFIVVMFVWELVVLRLCLLIDVSFDLCWFRLVFLYFGRFDFVTFVFCWFFFEFAVIGLRLFVILIKLGWFFAVGCIVRWLL